MNNLTKKIRNSIGGVVAKMQENRKEANSRSNDRLFNVVERNHSLYIVCGGVAVAKCDGDESAASICGAIQVMRNAQREFCKTLD